MKILVTGATGLVGNNCVRALEQDHEVHVLVRKSHAPQTLKGLQVTCHVGDLNKTDHLAESIPDVDTIIHAAGDTHIGIRKRPSQHVVNTLATKTIAEIAHSRGIRMVFVSSVDALPAGSVHETINEESQGVPKCPIGYVTSKRAAEQDILQRIDSGLDAVIVNPGFMLGPWDWKPSSGRMLLEIATQFIPFAPTGGFSICDVRDVTQAICRCLTKTAHRRYILAGRNMLYFDAWRMFASITESRAPFGSAGPVILSISGFCGDILGRISGNEPDINSGSVRMSKMFHYYDSSRAIADLGYQIRPTENTVQDAWDWFQKHGYVPKTG